MKFKARTECPGCGGGSLSPVLRLPRQPAVLNYRFPTVAAAQKVARRDVTLVSCDACGLVFNSTFDADAVPYDDRYENRQCFSPAFNDHLDSLSKGLIRRNKLNGGRILEVGCGKGDFLRRICSDAEASGDGYDTSFEAGAEPAPQGLRFFARYVAPEDIRHSYDAILCRHVVEHVPEIGQFLELLHDLAVASGDPVVVLETPRFEWIVEHTCLWDVFHEHCNYFFESALATLCRNAGFRVVRQRPVFDDQYQLVELRLAKNSKRGRSPSDRAESQKQVKAFGRRALLGLAKLEQKIDRAAAEKPWAVWGAGAKGVALVNQLPTAKPRCVIDSNPAKQGGVLPGTAVRIVAPADPVVSKLGLIVIANPNYAVEIRRDLARLGFTGRTFTL